MKIVKKIKEAPFWEIALLWGFIPIYISWFAKLIMLGTNFPGYCNTGDGLRCIEGGFAGYFQMKYFDTIFALFGWMIIGGPLVAIVVAYSCVIAKLIRFGLSGMIIGLIVQSCAIAYFVNGYLTNKWEPKFDKNCKGLYCSGYLEQGEKIP